MTETTNPGNNANYYDYDDSGHLIGSPYYRTEASEFELSESPYGTFDQGGNIWEWNEADIFGDSLSRGLRGGGFGDSSFSLAASTRNNYGGPALEDPNVGFRVASIPEPGSLVMMIGAVISLLAYAWRRRWQI